MADNDTKCLMFMETTGADPDAAKKFLEASAWSVENAINLYFTDPNMFNAPAAPPPQEQVRAPIAASFGTLAGPANPLYHGRQASTEPFRNYSQEWTRGSRQDERGLATLFSPPDYVFSGTLEQACISGMENSKWILVNVQTSEEFASHVLNRDIWKATKKNQVLVPIIKDKFIFCQRDQHSNFGMQFVNTYRITRLPCVSILNPITRALELNIPLKNIPEVNDVVGPILQFIEKKPHPQIPGSNNDSNNDSSFSEPSHNRRQSDELMADEDSIMARAIEESLKANNTNMDQTEEEEVEPEPQPVQNIYPAPKPEPAKDSSTTGLRIVLPNSKKVSRRFLKSDKVSELYAVIEHEHDAQWNDISKFVLTIPFPKLVLGVETLQKTLQELGLSRCVLTLTEI